MFLLLRVLLLPLTFLVSPAGGKEYSQIYTFLADRKMCDGQCTYCREAGHRHFWAAIQAKVSRYVYAMPNATGKEPPLTQDQFFEVQQLIDWSWEKGAHFTCIIGIIALRMLSYGFADPMQFTEDPEADVLDFLDAFNAHTGALDMLTSSWAAVLSGGWPFFRELLHVSRKVRAHTQDVDPTDPGRVFPRIADRGNECDSLDTSDDALYRNIMRRVVDEGLDYPSLGEHLVILRRGTRCPIGMAVAFLSVALYFIQHRGLYQGSLKDNSNPIQTLVLAAQDAVTTYVESKTNWSPIFDLLTTQWPLWEVLSELACVDTSRPCVSRSAWQCFDMVERQYLPCPHASPKVRTTFEACGEHDICTWPEVHVMSPEEWCVPFDRRPPEPRHPWLLELNHDAEERICTQCGQDGVLRTIFHKIGFRDAAGPASVASPKAAGLPPFFVEFGARKPDMLNSAVLRRYCSWDGVLLDSQPGETPHGGCRDCPGIAELVRTEFVTAENVVSLFVKHGVPKDFDLLTIDTDYNDYWIWRALLTDGTFRPRVVALDFNPDLPLDQAKAVRYEAMAEWDGTVYTVASLLAYALLARAHGYVFAYALEMGAHAFFIRADLVADADRDLPLRNVRKASHPPDELGRQFVDVLYDFPPRGPVVQSGRVGADTGATAVEVAELRREVRGLSEQLRELREALLARDRPQKPTGSSMARSAAPERRLDGGVHSAATSFYDEVSQHRS